VKSELVAPCAMIVSMTIASGVYFVKGNLSMSLYYLAGAAINVAVAFKLPMLPWAH
jgi:hypothetical protein